jgi:hypothetical protein
MSDQIITLRQLNRATLARQMLLQRDTAPVAQAVERLVGLQAQLAVAPYVGLWTRLQDFHRDDLAGLIENRKIIKATLMRATLHLCTAEDYNRFRTTLQPMLTSAWSSISKRRGADFDLQTVLDEVKRFISEKPRTFAEISAMVTELMPEKDVGAMRYAVRTHLPMVQVPVASGWSYPGKPEFTLAQSWLGRETLPEDRLDDLVLRYLAAFGPATATDMQTWSGLPKLKETFDRLKPDLQSYRGEQRRELFDLPDISIEDEDRPAPVRFLPEYDNLLLSHSNRKRVIADEFRSGVFLPGLRVRATFLLDGFVKGAWKIEKTKKTATLIIEPFVALQKQDRTRLTEEGEQLVRFVEGQADFFEVQFQESK